MGEIQADTLNSLAEKMSALDLTDAEQAVFTQLLDRAARYEPEVEGFDYSGFASGADLTANAYTLATSVGFVLPDTSISMEAKMPKLEWYF